MGDQSTQPVQASQPISTQVASLIERMEQLSGRQARIALLAYTTNCPATRTRQAVVDALEDALDIAESYD